MDNLVEGLSPSWRNRSRQTWGKWKWHGDDTRRPTTATPCMGMPSLYHARAAQALGERRWPRSQSGWPRWACPSTRVRADVCRERHRFFAPSRSQGPRRLLPRASAEDAARYRGACRYAGGPGSAPSRPEACSARNRRAPPAHRDVLRRCGLHRVIRQARPRRPPSRAIHASFAWTVPTLVDESLSLTLSGPFSRPNRQYRPHGCVSRPPRKEARSMAYC